MLFIIRSLSVFMFVFLMYACTGGGGRTVEAGAEQQGATTPADASIYALDPAQSYVTWVGSKVIGKHNGRFYFSSGEVAVLEGELRGADFEIDISSVEVVDLVDATENAELKGHLLSADFFDAENYPIGRFELVSVSSYDSEVYANLDKEEYESEYKPSTASENRVEGATHNITGNLTLRGTTRSITFPAQVSLEGDIFRAEARFNIDRTDFGISYGDEASVLDKAKDRFVYNTVNVGLVLVAQANREESTEEVSEGAETSMLR